MGNGSGSHRRFIHTTDHDLQVQFAGPADHPAGRGNATTLGELDIDPMKMIFTAIHISFHHTGFISI